jgi:hypothetical protein
VQEHISIAGDSDSVKHCRYRCQPLRADRTQSLKCTVLIAEKVNSFTSQRKVRGQPHHTQVAKGHKENDGRGD